MDGFGFTSEGSWGHNTNIIAVAGKCYEPHIGGVQTSNARLHKMWIDARLIR